MRSTLFTTKKASTTEWILSITFLLLVFLLVASVIIKKVNLFG
ncbi:MAG: hypothetical protein ACLFNM_00205 [Candidatus Woesearchaeota archaeon]